MRQRARRADHLGMSDDRRSAHALATGAGAVIFAVILVNVLLRVAPLPDIDLPAIPLPDFPGWVDSGAEVIHTIVKVKNWLVAAVVAVVIAGLALEAYAKSRGGARPDA
jgi:hypothetical protein